MTGAIFLPPVILPTMKSVLIREYVLIRQDLPLVNTTFSVVEAIRDLRILIHPCIDMFFRVPMCLVTVSELPGVKNRNEMVMTDLKAGIGQQVN